MVCCRACGTRFRVGRGFGAGGDRGPVGEAADGGPRYGVGRCTGKPGFGGVGGATGADAWAARRPVRR